MDEKKLRQLQLTEMEILKEMDMACKLNNIKYSITYGTAIGAVRHKGFIPWDDDIDVMMPIDDYLKFEKNGYKSMSNKMFFQNNKVDKNYYLFWNKIRKNNTTSIVKGYEHIKMHYGICIDIFPLFKYPANKKIANKHLRYMKISIACSEGILYKYGKKEVTSKKIKILYMILSILPRKFSNALSNYFMKKIIRYDGPFEKYAEYSELYKKIIFVDKNAFDNIKTIKFENLTTTIINNYDKYLKDIYGDYMKLPPKEEQIAHGDLIIDFKNGECINEK